MTRGRGSIWRRMVTAGLVPVAMALGCRNVEAPPHSSVNSPGSPEAILEALAAAGRLEPDRRLAQATRAVDLVAGTTPGEPTVQFTNGRWTFTRNGKLLGSAGQLPTFGELHAVLRAHADAAVAAHKDRLKIVASRASVDLPGDPREAVRQLRSLDEDWGGGKRSVEAVQRAAAALAVLELALADRMETADELAAHALGVVAVAEALGAEMPRERALLARRLGYQVDATTIAQNLPLGDPVRHYAASEREVLGGKAMAAGASPTLVLLYLDLMRREHQQQALREIVPRVPEAARELPAVHALRADLEWGALGGWTYLANTFLDLRAALGEPLAHPKGTPLGPLGLLLDALSERGGFERITGQRPGEVIPAIERDLGRLAAQGTGPFLPGPVHAAYYRGHLLSALDLIGEHYIKRLSSKQASDQFTSDLGRGTTPLGRNVPDYFADWAAAKAGALGTAAMIRDVDGLQSIGARPLYRLVEQAQRQSMLDPELLLMAREYGRRADTRPAHRDTMARVAWQALIDVALAERLGRGAVEAAPSEHVTRAVWLAGLDGDAPGIQRWLRDPRLTAHQRTVAIEELADAGLADDGAVRTLYEERVAAEPRAWRPVERYAKYLADRSDHARARQVLQAWLARPHDAPALEELVAGTEVARMLQLEGRLDEAWRTVQPLLPSWFSGALMRAALIRAQMGAHDEAVFFAQRRLDRYGDVAGIALLAGCYWQAGRFDDAAKLLASPPRRLTLTDFRWEVGRRFAEAFAVHRDTGSRAFKAMIDARIPPEALHEVAIELTGLGHHELAFATSSQLRPGGAGQLFVSATSYGALVKSRGQEEALRWLEQAIPRGREPMAMVAYEQGHYELLWSFVPEPNAARIEGRYAWLLRAAVWVRSRSPSAEWKQKLDAYYAGAPRDFYDLLGQHLLGKGDVATVWAQANSPDHQVEAEYFIALRAQSRGDIPRAIAWYRAAAESGQQRERELAWAYHQLWNWRHAHKSVARIALAPFE